MASSDIREYYFYPRYRWNAIDFTQYQDWSLKQLHGLFEGAFGSAVLSGLEITPLTGLNVQVSPGIAVTPSGRIAVLASAATGTFASPVGNPARSILVLRASSTDVTNIPEPTNLANTVQLHKQYTASALVIDGTPAASPSYPAKGSEDIIITGVRLNAGHTTIVADDLDYDRRDLPDFDQLHQSEFSSRTVRKRSTHFRPFMEIPTGITIDGEGDAVYPGGITGAGTLALTGTVIS